MGTKTMKKILTLFDLEKFCQEQKLMKFSSQETGYQLCVHVPATFEKQEEVEDPTIMFAYVRLFHIGINRNHSSVTKEAAEKSLATIPYKPLLANFCEINGERDFTAHDMEFDDEGNVTYIERQIGCFTADAAYIAHYDEYGKDYVYAKVAIPRDYTDAATIIEKKNGTKVSVELLINEMSYSVDDQCLLLTDITVQGATCLGKNPETGKNVEEGMIGARVNLKDFSAEKNSVCNFTEEENSKLIETLEKLTDAISNFNINNKDEQTAQKGGNDLENNKINELIEKYNVTVEDVTFETEGLSDKELEKIFEETFGEKVEEVEVEEKTEAEQEEFSKTCPECGATVDDDSTACPECGKDLTEVTENEEPEDDFEEEAVVEPEVEEEETKPEVEEPIVEIPIEEEKFTKTFALSHEDVKCALYNLLAPYEQENNDWYWIVEVFDNYFVYQGCCGNYFGQKYVKEDETVSFDGERYSLYAEFLTESERVALKEMRANYSSIEEELNKYKEAETKSQKEEILNDTAYAEFAEEDCMKEVIAKASEYSIQELRDAMDLALAKAYKSKKTFAVEIEEKKPVKVGFAYEEVADDEPYGDYFKSLKK